jgi:hypothetical protein
LRHKSSGLFVCICSMAYTTLLVILLAIND